jgi:hypothetical protein
VSENIYITVKPLFHTPPKFRRTVLKEIWDIDQNYILTYQAVAFDVSDCTEGGPRYPWLIGTGKSPLKVYPL